MRNRCLTNIASSHTRHTEHILGAAPQLISFLSTPNATLQEQALWCLGNIAGDNTDFREMLRANGALPPIFRLLQNSPVGSVHRTSLAMLRLISFLSVPWLLWCRHQYDGPSQEVVSSRSGRTLKVWSSCSTHVSPQVKRIMKPCWQMTNGHIITPAYENLAESFLLGFNNPSCLKRWRRITS